MSKILQHISVVKVKKFSSRARNMGIIRAVAGLNTIILTILIIHY